MMNSNKTVAVIVFVNEKVTAMYEILCHYNNGPTSLIKFEKDFLDLQY